MYSINMESLEKTPIDWWYLLFNFCNSNAYSSNNAAMDRANEYYFDYNRATFVRSSTHNHFKNTDNCEDMYSSDYRADFVAFFVNETDEVVLRKISLMLNTYKFYFTVLVLIKNGKGCSTMVEGMPIDLILSSDSVECAFQYVEPIFAVVSKKNFICVDVSDLKYGLSAYGKRPIVARLTMLTSGMSQILSCVKRLFTGGENSQLI